MQHIVHYNPGLPEGIPSPSYVVDLTRLADNVVLLDQVQERAGCTILCALKGFAMHSVFPLLKQKLRGVCASGPHEARLGAELFGREVHVFAPAFSDEDLREILPIAHHISFNSFEQWQRHRSKVDSCRRAISCGLRVNPEYSEVAVGLYDPCAPGSRLGIRRSSFEGQSLEGIDGLHFHTLCEQNSDALERTIDRFEQSFGEFLPAMRWVNFGGGHHITSPHYDVERLVRLIRNFKERHPHLEIYLEPGEAIALNTGVLVATVLELQHDAPDIAILDISATCHMPDVLEMPYRPEVYGAAVEDEKAYSYRLSGLSCLAGDTVGIYSFDERLRVGDKVCFLDMAHYTMVKTTTFNGIKHPSIVTWDPAENHFEVVRKFGYGDYRNRLS